MSNPIIPIILSGGSGSRLWPLSRESYPKQFLPLVDELTLLQQTVLRAKLVTDINPIIICNQQHRFLLAEQLNQIHCEADIVLEPCGKNTAPAVTIAGMIALQYLVDPILLILPADHVIENQEKFMDAVMSAKKCAMDGYLTTFGIQPNKPEVNYGYIRTGKKLNDKSFLIEKFVEKPSLEKAKQYLEEGCYFWNSGMFVFKATQFLDEIKEHNASIYNQSKRSFEKITNDLNFKRLPEKEFSEIKSDSIDYAVMEHCKKSAVVPLDAGWSDVGLWMALFEKRKLDEQGNSLEGDVLVQDVENSFISAHSRLVAAVGIQDLIIIETADAVLVANKHQAHEVKKIVDSLKIKDRKEAYSHKKIFRPWGLYETLVDGERYHVKRLVVNPGKSLSLQLHYHRAEHWTVVRGAGQVTCGEKTFLLSENESTYIPVGIKHRLENQGRIPLEIIEVQTGSYLDEDDIVRFEDHYGRVVNNVK